MCTSWMQQCAELCQTQSHCRWHQPLQRKGRGISIISGVDYTVLCFSHYTVIGKLPVFIYLKYFYILNSYNHKQRIVFKFAVIDQQKVVHNCECICIEYTINQAKQYLVISQLHYLSLYCHFFISSRMALYLVPYIPPEADQKPPNSMMLPHAIVVLASDYYFQRNVIY